MLTLITSVFLLLPQDEPSYKKESQGVIISKHIGMSGGKQLDLLEGDRFIEWREIMNEGAEWKRINNIFEWYYMTAIELAKGPIMIKGYRQEKELQVIVFPNDLNYIVQSKKLEYFDGRNGKVGDLIDSTGFNKEELRSLYQKLGPGDFLTCVLIWANEKDNESEIRNCFKSVLSILGYLSAKERYVSAVTIAKLVYNKKMYKVLLDLLYDFDESSQGYPKYSNFNRLILGMVGQSLYKLKNFEESWKSFHDLINKGSSLEIFDTISASAYHRLGMISYYSGNRVDAKCYLLKSLDLYNAIMPNTLIVGFIYNVIGMILLDEMSIEEASYYLETGYVIRNGIAPNSPYDLSSLNNIAVLEMQRGGYAKAREIFINIFESLSNNKNYGEGYFRALLNIAKAEKGMGVNYNIDNCLEHGVSVLEESGKSYKILSEFYLELANFYSGYNEYNRPRMYYLKCIKLLKSKSGEDVELAKVFHSFGNFYLSKGNARVAEYYYKKCARIYINNVGDSPALKLVFLTIGQLCLAQGRLEEACEYASKAGAMPEFSISQLRDRGLFHNFLGNLFKSLKNFDQALFHYAEDLFLSQKSARKEVSSAKPLNNLGIVTKILGDYDLSFEFLVQSLAIKKKYRFSNTMVGNTLANIGLLFKKQSNFKLAEFYLLESIKKYESDSHRLGRHYSSIYYYISLIYLEQGLFEDAEFFLNCALESYEEYLISLSDDFEVLAANREESNKIYLVLIDLLLKLKKYDKAFEVLQRYKSGLHYQSLLMVEKERKFQMEKAINEDSTEFPLYSITNFRGFSYNSLDDDLERDNPVFDAETVESLSIHSASSKLDANTLVVSYVDLKSGVFAFIIDSKGFYSVKNLNISSEELFVKINEMLDKGFLSHSSLLFNDFQKKSSEVYNSIVLSLDIEIENYDRLVIVPSQSTLNLPFSLLIDPTNGKYLVEKIPIIYSSSVSLYTTVEKNRKRKISKFVGFGDVERFFNSENMLASSNCNNCCENFTTKTNASKKSYDFDSSIRSDSLSRIPGSGIEVLEISKMFEEKGLALVREDATVANLIYYYNDADVIHIASHATSDHDKAFDSRIYFNIENNGKSHIDDGILYSWEIIQYLESSPELVVLSACQTALGKTYRGEGVFGLSQAFQISGARSIISSLWNINDLSTALFMAKFYQYLLSGLDKATSLQRAKVDFIRNDPSISKIGIAHQFYNLRQKKFSHPYYWAAFQLHGAWD